MSKKAKRHSSGTPQDVFDDEEEDDVIEERTEIDPPAETRPAEPKGNPPPPPEEVCEVVRAITAAFTAALPAAAAGGSYDMAEARAQVEAGVPLNLHPMPVVPDAVGVPDGSYRLDGSDWIVTVAGEKTTLFERASPTTDSERFTAVPAKLP